MTYTEKLKKAMEDMVTGPSVVNKTYKKADHDLVPNKTLGMEIPDKKKQQDVIPTQTPNKQPDIPIDNQIRSTNKVQPVPRSTNKRERKKRKSPFMKESKYKQTSEKYLSENIFGKIKQAFAPDKLQQVSNAWADISRVHQNAQNEMRRKLDAITDDEVKLALLNQVQAGGLIDVSADLAELQNSMKSGLKPPSSYNVTE